MTAPRNADGRMLRVARTPILGHRFRLFGYKLSAISVGGREERGAEAQLLFGREGAQANWINQPQGVAGHEEHSSLDVSLTFTIRPGG